MKISLIKILNEAVFIDVDIWCDNGDHVYLDKNEVERCRMCLEYGLSFSVDGYHTGYGSYTVKHIPHYWGKKKVKEISYDNDYSVMEIYLY